MLNAGHGVANHSFSHPQLTELPMTAVEEQLAKTSTLIKIATGEATPFFRPPLGARNAKIDQLATELGMRTVLWNIDSRDWADPVPESIADKVIQGVRHHDGGVVLLHDIHRQTVEAVPLILDQLQTLGYETTLLLE
jgi:peptidoglycan/xylan/chitin deacetylase (PgdA/CDA1 family)